MFPLCVLGVASHLFMAVGVIGAESHAHWRLPEVLLSPCHWIPYYLLRFEMTASFICPPAPSPSQCVFERVILNPVSLLWLETQAHLHVLKCTHVPTWPSAFDLFWFSLSFKMTEQGARTLSLTDVSAAPQAWSDVWKLAPRIHKHS